MVGFNTLSRLSWPSLLWREGGIDHLTWAPHYSTPECLCRKTPESQWGPASGMTCTEVLPAGLYSLRHHQGCYSALPLHRYRGEVRYPVHRCWSLSAQHTQVKTLSYELTMSWKTLPVFAFNLNCPALSAHLFVCARNTFRWDQYHSGWRPNTTVVHQSVMLLPPHPLTVTMNRALWC